MKPNFLTDREMYGHLLDGKQITSSKFRDGEWIEHFKGTIFDEKGANICQLNQLFIRFSHMTNTWKVF